VLGSRFGVLGADVTDLRTGSTTDVRAAHERAHAEYTAFCARGLTLNLGRGKPSEAQLDLSNALLSLPGEGDFRAADGTDCRNYGGLQGLPELRTLVEPLLGAPAERIVAAGNASLTLMHDTVRLALRHGVPGGDGPWSEEDDVTFLCPVPGYDRHFTICEGFGIRMVAVPLTGQGPDVAVVEQLAGRDPSVKGMWCVPKYSNPTGEVYASDVIERLAAMNTAAPDFRLFWDNAYGVHHLTATRHEIANVLELAARHDHPDRAFVFASTSKITFAGAGVAFFASSAANVKWLLGHMERSTIGPDKLNQLRHVRLLKSADGMAAHMEAHARLLAPKFRAVQETFAARLAGSGVATWTEPAGGYFISLDVLPGCARRSVALAKDAGIVVVPAGSTYPHGRDPEDRNIRIAPSYPTLGEVTQAAEGLALSVLVATTESILAERGEAVAAPGL
jgi:DNA-binding transcriptional MocR family regulator